MYPETPATTDQSRPETVLQLDIREPSSCVTQTEQRSKTITDTGKKYPTKYSSLRMDQNRKPFFTLTKSPKIILQSSASTSSLSRPARQIIDTPTVYNSSGSPWKEYTSQDFKLPMLEVTPDQSPEVTDSKLQLPQVNLPPLKAKSPRHMVRRHRSIEVPSNKGIQWTRVVRTQRQITTSEDVSPVEEILLETRSSPNLKHLGDDLHEPTNDTCVDEPTSSDKGK